MSERNYEFDSNLDILLRPSSPSKLYNIQDLIKIIQVQQSTINKLTLEVTSFFYFLFKRIILLNNSYFGLVIQANSNNFKGGL